MEFKVPLSELGISGSAYQTAKRGHDRGSLLQGTWLRQFLCALDQANVLAQAVAYCTHTSHVSAASPRAKLSLFRALARPARDPEIGQRICCSCLGPRSATAGRFSLFNQPLRKFICCRGRCSRRRIHTLCGEFRSAPLGGRALSSSCRRFDSTQQHHLAGLPAIAPTNVRPTR